MQDGLITGVGQGVAIPPGTKIIDAAGADVYPGWINARTTVGLAEPGPRGYQDTDEMLDFNPQLRTARGVPQRQRVAPGGASQRHHDGGRVPVGHTPGTMSFLVDVAVAGVPAHRGVLGRDYFRLYKKALTDYAASIERFLEISVDKGAGAIVSTHPYFDFSVQKVLAIESGNKNAFILGGTNTPVGGDNTLEFMLTSINVTAQHKLKTFLD